MAISRYEGKIEKSSTRRVCMLASNVSTASPMFITSKRSRTVVGSGTTIIATMPMMAAGIAICPTRLDFTGLRNSHRAVRGGSMCTIPGHMIQSTHQRMS